MIFSIKKKTIVIAAIVLAAIIAVIAITAVSIGTRQTSAFNGQTVVIDAGHGGIDGGVVGRVTGVREADINLAITRKTQQLLEQKGFRVILTRNSADGLYGMATRNRKLRDMETRRDIINRANPDLVISIHQNSFPSASVRGPQVFFNKSANSECCCREKAEIMQNALNVALDSDRLSKPGDFFIISSTPHPALLIESGFLSNSEEEQLLITPEHQEKIAYAIATGVQFILLSE